MSSFSGFSINRSILITRHMRNTFLLYPNKSHYSLTLVALDGVMSHGITGLTQSKSEFWGLLGYGSVVLCG